MARPFAEGQKFQIARKAADTVLGENLNIRGTCFGFKKRAGIVIDEPSFIVFVKEKMAAENLSRAQLIPSEMRRNGMDWPTDVIQIDAPSREARFGIQDGRQQGTLGCFARMNDDIYGVSCAHCIGGIDGNPFTYDDVVIEFPTAGNLLRLGRSTHAIEQRGTGMLPEFGDLDLGLISVEDQSVKAFATTRAPLTVYRPPANILDKQHLEDLLKYTQLAGFGGVSGLRTGMIRAVMVSMPPYRFDLMITAPDGSTPLTTKGDSGMLWIGPFGRAFGFHTMGDRMGPASSSVCTFSSFAHRAVDHFGVSLYTL